VGKENCSLTKEEEEVSEQQATLFKRKIAHPTRNGANVLLYYLHAHLKPSERPETD